MTEHPQQGQDRLDDILNHLAELGVPHAAIRVTRDPAGDRVAVAPPYDTSEVRVYLASASQRPN